MKIKGSSTVADIDYNPETRVMRVEFHSGGTYTFHDVPDEDHQSFMAADSKGKHFHRHVRGRYESKKVA